MSHGLAPCFDVCGWEYAALWFAVALLGAGCASLAVRTRSLGERLRDLRSELREHERTSDTQREAVGRVIADESDEAEARH